MPFLREPADAWHVLDPVVRRWHRMRQVVGLLGVAAAVVPGPLGDTAWLGLGGLVGFTDATLSLRGHRPSVLRSLLLDAAVTGVALTVLRSSPPTVVAWIVYLAVLAVGLMPLRDAARLVPVGAAWVVAPVVARRVWGPAAAPGFDAAMAIIAGVLALVVIVYLGDAMETLVRRDRAALGVLDARSRHQQALVLCSRALLRGGDVAIDEALEALRRATGAHQVFVDVNVNHPTEGLCARVVHELLDPAFEERETFDLYVTADGERLEGMLPYHVLPTSYAGLRRLRPAIVQTDELPPGPERRLYEESGVRSELNVPIVVGGRWHGSLGLGVFDERRDWTPRDVELLGTAADMFGSYYERAQDRERLEELVEAKDELIASVSHELRTPLSVIVGLASELRDRGDEFGPEERAQFVELIATHSEEMADLVEDLLAKAADAHGELVVVPEVVALDELVAEVLRQRLVPDDRSLTVETAVVKAWADPGRVRQILRNLLTNAVRYGGPDLVVRILPDGHVVAVEVADDGEGIPADRVAEAFEPFGRGHDRTTQTQSVGLGLPLSVRLAELMGGALVYRRKEGWTVFRLELPRVEE
ncbi:MAG TPA: GAF domain-containing protein [Actinobacteria bacterium]|nr:GAF domain-containing protein [Actinomycetota bacterium]